MRKGAIELAELVIEQLREEATECLEGCRLLAAQEKDDLALKLEDALVRIRQHRGSSEDWARLQGAVVSAKDRR